MFTTVVLFACAFVVSAQSPGADSFNPPYHEWVRSLAVQVDGKILTGGNRTSDRLNPDGSLDMRFDESAYVFSLGVQADRKILIGGDFDKLCGQPQHGLGRVNTDGSLDASFNLGADGHGIKCLAVQADGKILVGGDFETLGGQGRTGIGRLNSDGTLDTGFNPQATCDDLTSAGIGCVAVQADGKILIGGHFDKLCGQPRQGLGRFNPNGSLDRDFLASADSEIACLAVQADGKILVGGRFKILNGRNRGGIGRLDADGSLDMSFDPRADWAEVNCFAVQADGKILVGGEFQKLGGQHRDRIGRLNADGTLDAGFNPEASWTVSCLAVQPDGKILVGGSFGKLGGQSCFGMGRLTNTEPATQKLICDGSTVTWLRGGSSPGVWRTIFEYTTSQTDWTVLGPGKRITGGWQLTGVSLPAGHTLRARGYVISSASAWFVEDYLGAPTITAPPTSRTNYAGTAAILNVQAGGTGPLNYQWWENGTNLVDGGRISGATTATLTVGNSVNCDAGDYWVVVSNSWGRVKTAPTALRILDPSIIGQPKSQSKDLGQQVIFNVVAGGTWPLSYQWRKEGTALAGATNSWFSQASLRGTDAGGYSVVVSNLYGSVTSAVAKLEANSATVDESFNPKLNPAPKSSVRCLGVQSDGKILVGGLFDLRGGSAGYRGGTFTNVGGQVRYRAISLTNLGGQVPNRGNSLTNFGVQTRHCLARLNADGDIDTSFAPTVSGPVLCVAMQQDGKIMVGGSFTNLCGQARHNIGRLNADGSLDTTFDPGVCGLVCSLAIQDDGKVLTGGTFTNLCGQTRRHIGRLNVDGSLDTDFNPGADGTALPAGYVGTAIQGVWRDPPNVSSLAVQKDGKILVGGSFTNLCRQTRRNIGRLNADGSLDASFDPTPDGIVKSLVLQADGKILLGGSFTSLFGQPRHYICRINADGSLDTRFNPPADAHVDCLAVQADGKVLLTGRFGTLCGERRIGIGRVNVDGSLDTRFNLGTKFNPAPDYDGSCLAVQADGRILVAGRFQYRSSYGCVLVRLNLEN